MSKKLPKRFYKSVAVEPVGERYCVKLDQYTLKTPGKKALEFTKKAHAERVAQEWDAQTTHIRPELMPCTRLYNVAVERTPETRDAVIAEGVKYAGTDLLCYRDAEGSALSRHQDTHWGPVLSWAETQGMRLRPTASLTAIAQDPVALSRVEAHLSALDDLNLTLAVHYIATLGSAILGLAVVAKHLSAQDAFMLSRLDELWQIDQWGEVDDAKDRADQIEIELVALSDLIG